MFHEDAVSVKAVAEYGRGVVSRTVLGELLLLAAPAGLLGEALNTADVPARAVVWRGLAVAAYGYGLLCVILAIRRRGHCLPIDPSYLSWREERALGQRFRFVELANDINSHMLDYVVHLGRR